MVCRGDAGMVEVIRVQLWSKAELWVCFGRVTCGLEVKR